MERNDPYAAAFIEEAGELLADLEATLLELEQAPEDADLVGRAFRNLHTIKGSGSMFGFDDVSAFTHEVETVFDQLRTRAISVSAELVGVALEAKDLIREMICGTLPAGGEDQARLTASLRALATGGAAARAPAVPPPAMPLREALSRTFRIRFRPGPDVPGQAGESLLQQLQELGECLAIVPGTGGSPGGWDVIFATHNDESAVRDVFFLVDGPSEVRIDLIDDGTQPGEEPDYKLLGEILVERGDVTAEQVREALGSRKRLGDILEEQGIVPPEAMRAAALEQRVVRELRTEREALKTETAASVRVAADKLDHLVNLVGELVIAQARLTQTTAKRRTDEELRDPGALRRHDAALRAIAEDVARIAAELRDQTLGIRMVPIGTTFSRFKRLVRDLSSELGKEIDLVTEGAETELDKTMIERLGDPLVHLIRNSCDHGIESPDVRSAKGKPAKGTIRLAASQRGPNVHVEITDDGAGLDPEKIRRQAIEKHLVDPEAKLSEKELFGLILLPGFSTAHRVSNLSGRGVGMDVVKRSVDALRGSLEIESVPGQGTTLRIVLPLTLAIVEGLLVEVGDQSYVLPLSAVEECVELSRKAVEDAHGSRLAIVRGELVPYLRLRDWFGLPGDRPEIEQIAVVNIEGFRFGFVLDRVVGQHQTVIKPLGTMYREVEGLSGATILGDGSVALILDVPALARTAVASEKAH